jgi:hypothetical protein
MNRWLLTLTASLGALAVAVALAHGATNPSSETPSGPTTMQPRAQDMMGDNMMGQQGNMMQMMMHCASMMQEMQGEMVSGMRMPNGSNGTMNQQMSMEDNSGLVRYDQETAEALARAFLTGRNAEAEIHELEVETDDDMYTVSYRQGDATGTLTVDATTGEVRAGR